MPTASANKSISILIRLYVNHNHVPWAHAIGNMIAPAIRKPHDAVLKHTMT